MRVEYKRKTWKIENERNEEEKEKDMCWVVEERDKLNGDEDGRRDEWRVDMSEG